MTLREVLHAHIPTLTVDSTFRDAVDKMDIYQFPSLVVVDPEMKPLAVITEGDLSRAVNARGSLLPMANEPAMAYATQFPTTIEASAEVSEALHKMLMSGLTILPVVEEDRLSGVVLRVDLMQAMLADVHGEE